MSRPCETTTYLRVTNLLPLPRFFSFPLHLSVLFFSLVISRSDVSPLLLTNCRRAQSDVLLAAVRSAPDFGSKCKTKQNIKNPNKPRVQAPHQDVGCYVLVFCLSLTHSLSPLGRERSVDTPDSLFSLLLQRKQRSNVFR